MGQGYEMAHLWDAVCLNYAFSALCKLIIELGTGSEAVN